MDSTGMKSLRFRLFLWKLGSLMNKEIGFVY
jgi:hypothetical protein